MTVRSIQGVSIQGVSIQGVSIQGRAVNASDGGGDGGNLPPITDDIVLFMDGITLADQIGLDTTKVVSDGDIYTDPIFGRTFQVESSDGSDTVGIKASNSSTFGGQPVLQNAPDGSRLAWLRGNASSVLTPDLSGNKRTMFILWAYQAAQVATVRNIWPYTDEDGDSTRPGLQSNSSTRRVKWGTTPRIDVAQGLPVKEVPILSTIRADQDLASKELILRENGAEIGSFTGTLSTSNTASFAGEILRESGWFDQFVEVAEVIIYETALSDADILTIESYLTSKYGL